MTSRWVDFLGLRHPPGLLSGLGRAFAPEPEEPQTLGYHLPLHMLKLALAKLSPLEASGRPAVGATRPPALRSAPSLFLSCHVSSGLLGPSVRPCGPTAHTASSLGPPQPPFLWPLRLSEDPELVRQPGPWQEQRLESPEPGMLAEVLGQADVAGAAGWPDWSLLGLPGDGAAGASTLEP